ncbi:MULTISPECIES: hypothetical protein [unclassified Breznakia]|uniref:hypothetical protein n=1 Tax=unclassified Breznakia TaxID=2623764 RepID=UPI00247499E9|nr:MULTISPECIES: hypothetical protein [unclassified Breznakia]MDH6367552.1 hypothetical protein [Breznakia sp. PH1-1]MDH6404654.1 hypothetical protein [Breznakia sp. PF1-11]MDH6412382.1 hypothetical protein [Breznakia sp. PFB1-11]MDH6414720.1 hypothetical protein [Breznakia sp. PFB1-14]MDH6417035.1 hypothetical protein [Breznakia sp. PFB1-4]
MLYARKENREYKVDETSKKTYLAKGFDIYNDKGEVVEKSPLSKISVAEHEKQVAEAVAEATKDAVSAEELKAKDDAIAQLTEANKAKDEAVADLKAKLTKAEKELKAAAK